MDFDGHEMIEMLRERLRTRIVDDEEEEKDFQHLSTTQFLIN